MSLTYCVLACYFSTQAWWTGPYVQKLIIVPGVIPNLGHSLSMPHSQQFGAQRHAALDGWRAGKRCLTEKPQALSLLKSSERSRGGMISESKRLPTFSLKTAYIPDIKRLFNTAQKDWKLKAETPQQETWSDYLTRKVSLRKQIAKGLGGFPSPEVSPRCCQLHGNKAFGCV